MFAGLPGLGVGTLFYVLTALWMPIAELWRVARGDSSLARWRRIAVQFSYALSIIASIVAAERVLLWGLGATTTSQPSNPAAILNRRFEAWSPDTIYAAPIMASMALLAAVLLVVQVWAWGQHLATSRASLRLRRAADADGAFAPLTDNAPELADGTVGR